MNIIEFAHEIWRRKTFLPFRKRKSNFCRHWIELEDGGGSFEYCRGARRRVVCCAGGNGCSHPEFYEEAK